MSFFTKANNACLKYELESRYEVNLSNTKIIAKNKKCDLNSNGEVEEVVFDMIKGSTIFKIETFSSACETSIKKGYALIVLVLLPGVTKN